MTQHQILAHNILESIIGRTQDRRPIIDTASLDVVGSLSYLNQFLSQFGRAIYRPYTGKTVDEFLAAYSAEWQTAEDVLKSAAYNFRTDFAVIWQEIDNLCEWAGRSPYRITAVTAYTGASIQTISSILSCVAVDEALACQAAFQSLIFSKGSTQTLIDPIAFETRLQSSPETI